MLLEAFSLCAHAYWSLGVRLHGSNICNWSIIELVWFLCKSNLLNICNNIQHICFSIHMVALASIEQGLKMVTRFTSFNLNIYFVPYHLCA